MSQDTGGKARSGLSRRRFLATGAKLAAVAALARVAGPVAGRARAAVAPIVPDGERRLSLIAVGDTGKPPHLGPLSRVRRVGRAMAAHHREAPCDGLVFLGDNFYPDGVTLDSLRERVRGSLVEPFREFLALSPRGARELAVDAAVPGGRPVPAYAVLGNHDYYQRESPELQAKLLPELLPGWRMPHQAVAVHELEGGVSLILFHSVRWDDGVQPALLEALRRSRGPFRILASHYPMADPGNNFLPTFTRDLWYVFRQAAVPVHLYLSGHEHSLQAFRMESPAPALHVISGGGSDIREIHATGAQRDFALAELGFVRVDRLDTSEGPILDVTFHAVEGWALPGLSPSRMVARARVDETGQARIWRVSAAV